ncbi:MAG: hypothetical protein KAI43_10835 [Candidatus Aureabacteria bacterium]|nr:hypothetical protein [Candidatus Auribacterota bacterium]
MKRFIVVFLFAFGLYHTYLFAQDDSIQFPIYVYEDFESSKNHGVPSGWMGDYRDILLNLNYKDNPYSGKSCLKITYTAKGSRKAYWAGIMWQYPANNDGAINSGINLGQAKKVIFWARGKKGGEIIDSFSLGGAIGSYPDSDSVSIKNIVLSKEWKEYEIDLKGHDLRYISGFFSVVASKYKNPKGLTFYLDEVRIE